MVFHKQPSVTHRSFSKRKEIMNETIEPSTSRMIGSARGLEPGRTAKLGSAMAEWAANAWGKPIVKGASRYAIR